MRQMQSVLWRKGVMLSPQHLQAQDRFFEGLVDFQLSASTPFPWGYLELELDAESVAGGTLAVVQAQGIFPDGLIFSVPEPDLAPPPLTFVEGWPADAPSQVVSLAIPERRLSARNVGSGPGDVGYRFIAEAIDRRDDNTGLAGKPIQVARKNLRLLAESDTLDGHTLLPIARILRLEGDRFELDATFVPPLLSLAASGQLRAIGRRLVELMIAKGAELSASRSERKRGVAHFGASEVAKFWLLHTINTYLPQGRHLLEVDGSHPMKLYDWMLGLGGALTTFSRDVDTDDFPSYAHGDLGGCFGRLDETVRSLLGTVLPTRHAAVPFAPMDRSIFGAELEQERYLRADQYYIAIAAGVEPAELAIKVPKLVKVSSADRIEQVTDHGLPGLEITHQSTPPSAVPVKLDYTYFRLDATGDHWEAIRRSRRLAAYVPDEFPDCRMELVMLLNAQDGGS